MENATLRHQINVLRRNSGRPRLGLGDRLRLLLSATLLPSWRNAIVLVQPETVLKWHRAGYRLFWRHRSKSRNHPRVSAETIALIRSMAKDNRLCGAERIRGELLKLGIRVAKRTIQKYLRGSRGEHGGQDWATFLANHAEGTWACDFIQAYDILFRQVYAFFIVHLGSRKVVYTAACRSPTQEWTAQRLRNATMDGDAPEVLLRDRAVAERFVGTGPSALWRSLHDNHDHIMPAGPVEDSLCVRRVHVDASVRFDRSWALVNGLYTVKE